MKKLCIIALALVLTLSFAACGRKDKNEGTNTTVPTTENSILPDMDPTTGTNVPDSDVEGAVPDGTDGLDGMMDDITGDTNGNTDGNGDGAMGSTNGNTGSSK